MSIALSYIYQGFKWRLHGWYFYCSKINAFTGKCVSCKHGIRELDNKSLYRYFQRPVLRWAETEQINQSINLPLSWPHKWHSRHYTWPGSEVGYFQRWLEHLRKQTNKQKHEQMLNVNINVTITILLHLHYTKHSFGAERQLYPYAKWPRAFLYK